MPWVRFVLVSSLLFGAAFPLNAGLGGGTLIGIVSLKGSPPKRTPLDLAKEPACAKMYAKDPLTDETVVTGRGNGLANAVVYISGGEGDNTPLPANALVFDAKGCRYKKHVVAVSIGQEIQITNSDPISHNIHAIAKENREWSRMQPPGTPPFSYSYEKEEVIPVKCNIHPWMQAYFVVLKTRHFAVTGEDGVFHLPDLPAGKYTVTAWHESLGTQSQEITITSGEITSAYLVFPARAEE